MADDSQITVPSSNVTINPFLGPLPLGLGLVITFVLLLSMSSLVASLFEWFLLSLSISFVNRISYSNIFLFRITTAWYFILKSKLVG